MKLLVERYESHTQNLIVENPYLKTITINTKYTYNHLYGDNRVCICGHQYYRHFDSYENYEACGCKY